MVQKNRDSKFIIYQVLYIFVITVLALKGADLDLNRVVLKDEVVNKSVRDSLMVLLDSLTSSGIKFDVKVEENALKENESLKEKLASLNTKIKDMAQKIKDTPPPPKPEEKPVLKEQEILQSPISLKQTFIQYTWNKAQNSGSVPTYLYDPKDMKNPIAVIPPGQEKTFDLTNQTEVVAKYGSQQDVIKVVPNKPPVIKIDRATTKMNNSDIYVQDLQRITVFTVKIIDERPEQLKVTWNGPISVSGPFKDNLGNPVYNVSLKIASTENKFDEWLDKYGNLREADGRYKVNFFFTVVDERSKDRVQVGDSFYFTDFSK
ncbi:MAG TPA: hypothetical protein VLB50_14405 [Ignavibacteriaceae bacterium]|nr:hypothetical protein [Ignavibacteriaceae bacterium]